mgnify:CR=1 FL=1|jgi:UDP-glucuronate 4-epimerase
MTRFSNLGGARNPITLHTLIGFIEKALGRKATIVGKPFHIAVIKETWADIRKAKRLLDWGPLTTPEEGFKPRRLAYREPHVAEGYPALIWTH